MTYFWDYQILIKTQGATKSLSMIMKMKQAKMISITSTGKTSMSKV